MSTDSGNAMVAQVESLPELIRAEFERFDSRVRGLLSDEECRAVQRVVIEGCGDSHNAGVAAELAFEQLAGIPAEPMTAMQAARYAAPYLSATAGAYPLVVGISASGTVARTREALLLAGQHGALTVALTANAGSPVAGAAARVLDCGIPDFVFSPGVRSYRASLLALYLLAIRLGEARGHLTAEQAGGLRAELRATADAIEATIAAANGPARELAAALTGEKHFVFIGDGPNYATALFSAAKVMEAAGRHAIGQETEEWAHLQYFIAVEPSTPTFVISPGRRGHDRAAELMVPMRRIGRRIIAVVPQGDQLVAPLADSVLPVAGSVREAFTPMVYAVPGELFAAHLADVLGEPFFRDFAGLYSNEVGGNTIRASRVIESIEE